MMADFMNRILSSRNDVIFLVSTLSKGNLAKQNFDVFEECAGKNGYSSLNPYLISSEISGEESLFIPIDYNVYVLPRDLYKKDSRLMQGGLENFLQTITHNLFGKGLNKEVYLIKDECHQATNNLDAISNQYFSRIVNMSATPNLKRGQKADVSIADEDAEMAKLIKHVVLGAEEDAVENALEKFQEVKERYRNLLGVNPCLIIQISNKDKGEEESRKIENTLKIPKFQNLKWMSIVDKKERCRTNDKIEKLPLEKWKSYAKTNSSTIDVIIFKMVISEGWDIPRACMLYQIRDSQSEQLTEQVIGRVRRNPRLRDFETLSPEAQELAMTAWVWGILPEEKKCRCVKLCGESSKIQSALQVKTTILKPLTQRKNFDVNHFVNQQKNTVVHESIFKLYSKLLNTENEIRKMCYDYASENIQKWQKFCENIDAVKKEYDSFICNYEESMDIRKDEKGREILSSFPISSSYVDNGNYNNISDWIWRRTEATDKFSFDSEAEREWSSVLQNLEKDGLVQVINVAKEIEPDLFDETKEEKKFLWGKNFLEMSDIKFEYYLNGIHASYPDFIMKDGFGRIHLFEVKSVNKSSSLDVDSEEYQDKIQAIKECYKYSSIKTGYVFYLPVLKDDTWQITRFVNGVEENITVLIMRESMAKENFPEKNAIG